MAIILAIAPKSLNNEILAAWFSSEVKRIFDLNHKVSVLQFDSQQKLLLPKSVALHKLQLTLLGGLRLTDIVYKNRPDFIYVPLVQFGDANKEKLLIAYLRSIAQTLKIELVIGHANESISAQIKNDSSTTQLDTFFASHAFDDSDSWQSRIAVSELPQPKVSRHKTSDWLVLNKLTDMMWLNLAEKFKAAPNGTVSKIILLNSSGQWTSRQRRDFIAQQLGQTTRLPISLVDSPTQEKLLELLSNTSLVIFDPKSNHEGAALEPMAQVILTWALRLKKQIYPPRLILQNENEIDRLYHCAFSN